MIKTSNLVSMDQYYSRLIEKHLMELMHELPAIAIDGLKGIGKTATATRLAQTVFELDKEGDAILVANSMSRLGTSPRPVLIDEWQKIPQVWDFVRREVDAGAPAGAFLLTGSIANADVNIHSGAGRILKTRMFPLSLAERGLSAPTVSLGSMLASGTPFALPIAGETEIRFEQYMQEIVASGLPGLRRFSSSARSRMMDSYLASMLSHDFVQQGIHLRQPQTLMRWLRAYAASVSTDAGYTEILDASTPGESAKPAAKTTIAYREALENLWLIDEVPAWLNGTDYHARLKRTPKHFLADPAFAAYLLNIDSDRIQDPSSAETGFDAKYGNIVGRLFESLVQLSLRTYAAVNDATLSFLRTQSGHHEVDFILQRGNHVVAVEVKLSPSVKDDDVRHLLWLKEIMGTDLSDAVVLTTGNLAYRRQDGIAVVPAVLLGA